MNKSIKRLVEKTVSDIIKEVIASYDGAATFRGGPYGIGGRKQLVTINPATEKISKIEQNELNTNVEDQAYVNRKFKTGMGPFYKAQDINTDIDVEAEKEEIQLQERNVADSFYSHLPGFPQPNAIEYPVQHVPEENKMPNNLKAGVHDGTDEYLIDDIVDEIEDSANLKEFAISDAGANDDYSKKSALPPFFVNKKPNSKNLSLGHLYLEPADSSSVGSVGSVIFPKKFVPDDQPVQQSKIDDYDLDGISDDIDLDQPPEIKNIVR